MPEHQQSQEKASKIVYQSFPNLLNGPKVFLFVSVSAIDGARVLQVCRARESGSVERRT